MDPPERASPIGLDIARARDDDAPRLAALVARVWLETYAPEGASAAVARYVAEELDAAAAARWIADPHRRVLIAGARGEALGTAVVRRHASVRPGTGARVELERLYVRGPSVGRGVGRALLGAAREAARSFAGGGAGLWLTVNASNARALVFYRRAGFVETGTEDFTLDGRAHANLVLADGAPRPDAPRPRRAAADDLASLGAIERDAAARFSREDLPERLRGDASGEAELRAAARANLLWTIDGPDGSPAGFLRASVHADAVHLDEVSVARGHGGRGLGRALVDAFLAAAREAGHARATLTTFGHVPWNGPFYRSCGFAPLAPEAAGERLRDVLAREARAGLRGRVAMGLPLAGGGD